MSQQSHHGTYFAFGILAGVVIGLLYAPRTGKETREMIKKTVDDNHETIEKTKESAEELIQKTKTQIESLIDNVSKNINEKIESSTEKKAK